MKKLWTDELIEESIKKVMTDFDIGNCMPPANWLKIKGHGGLAVAIGKHGGYEYWAKRLGLERKISETIMGQGLEKRFCEECKRNGWACDMMSTKFPYDVLINKSVKIDVKASHLFKGRFGNYYSFGLGCKNRKSDFIVAYCIDDSGNIEKKYIIPSVMLEGVRQLSIGSKTSKYDKYLQRDDLIGQYIRFYQAIKSA